MSAAIFGLIKKKEGIPLTQVAAKWKRPLYWCLACAVGFAGLALLVLQKKASFVNDVLIRFVQGWESPWLTPIMIFVSRMGTGLPIVLLTAGIVIILYRFFRHGRELILFLTVVIGSSLLNVLLKALFHMERPTLHRLAQAAGYGFPSGHAMAAFSLYGITAFLLWKHTRRRVGRMLLIAAAAFLILAIGISRIYLGVHYPTDVMGGYLAAGCWLSGCIAVFRRTS